MATITIKQAIQVPNTMDSNTNKDIKLLYFNLRGRAEPARLLLAYAGLPYEDERIPPPWEDPDGWAARKPSLPFGQLPILYWNKEEISQGIGVARFIAKKIGLAGKTDMEAAQVDEVVHAIEDIVNARIAFLLEEDAGRKKTLTDTFTNRTLPTLLGQLERRLEGRGGQFFVGNNLTWADIQTFMLVTEMDKEMAKKYPKVENLVERVGQIPNIKKWVQSRPETAV